MQKKVVRASSIELVLIFQNEFIGVPYYCIGLLIFYHHMLNIPFYAICSSIGPSRFFGHKNTPK